MGLHFLKMKMPAIASATAPAIIPMINPMLAEDPDEASLEFADADDALGELEGEARGEDVKV